MRLMTTLFATLLLTACDHWVRVELVKVEDAGDSSTGRAVRVTTECTAAQRVPDCNSYSEYCVVATWYPRSALVGEAELEAANGELQLLRAPQFFGDMALATTEECHQGEFLKNTRAEFVLARPNFEEPNEEVLIHVELTNDGSAGSRLGGKERVLTER